MTLYEFDKIINNFRGEYDFLSNFHVGHPIELWDVTFPTTEHAYQWNKTDDPIERDSILWRNIESNTTIVRVPTTPGQAKSEGHKVRFRENWKEPGEPVRTMLEIRRAQFSQHADLRQKLIETRDALLVEGNVWHDNYWGSCTCEKAKCNNTGQNLLGKVLMQIRSEQ